MPHLCSRVTPSHNISLLSKPPYVYMCTYVRVCVLHTCVHIVHKQHLQLNGYFFSFLFGATHYGKMHIACVSVFGEKILVF